MTKLNDYLKRKSLLIIVLLHQNNLRLVENKTKLTKKKAAPPHVRKSQSINSFNKNVFVSVMCK